MNMHLVKVRRTKSEHLLAFQVRVVSSNESFPFLLQKGREVELLGPGTTTCTVHNIEDAVVFSNGLKVDYLVTLIFRFGLHRRRASSQK